MELSSFRLHHSDRSHPNSMLLLDGKVLIVIIVYRLTVGPPQFPWLSFVTRGLATMLNKWYKLAAQSSPAPDTTPTAAPSGVHSSVSTFQRSKA